MTDISAGDLVKCVDDRPSLSPDQIMPELDRLYVVSNIRPVGEGFSVRLQELAPTCHLGGPCGCKQCGWDSRRFRRIYRPDPELIASLLSKVHEPIEES